MEEGGSNSTGTWVLLWEQGLTDCAVGLLLASRVFVPLFVGGQMLCPRHLEVLQAAAPCEPRCVGLASASADSTSCMYCRVLGKEEVEEHLVAISERD